jgi:hypothetical protein
MNSTLALKKSDYEREVSIFRGFGHGPGSGDTEWTAKQLTIIQADVASGLRRFYFCGHAWTFMQPMASVILREGESKVTMPDDYGGKDGGTEVLVLNANGQQVAQLGFSGAGKVAARMSTAEESSGSPELLAEQPIKQMAPGKMQNSEIAVFPIADQDYTLKFPYFITPNYLLDVSFPYAYGGIEHHQTILECCLAASEVGRDNSLGVHSAEAHRLLAESIHIDRRKQPTILGYNGDRSDGPRDRNVFGDHRNWTQFGGVTINGVLYD